MALLGFTFRRVHRMHTGVIEWGQMCFRDARGREPHLALHSSRRWGHLSDIGRDGGAPMPTPARRDTTWMQLGPDQTGRPSSPGMRATRKPCPCRCCTPTPRISPTPKNTPCARARRTPSGSEGPRGERYAIGPPSTSVARSMGIATPRQQPAHCQGSCFPTDEPVTHSCSLLQAGGSAQCTG